jgi:hypothetical protein
LLFQRPVVADSGVVDQYVEPAMTPGKVGEKLPVSWVGDVASECFHPGLAVVYQFGEPVGSAGGDDDVRSGGVQHPGESRPQAGRGTRHQRDLAVQPPPGIRPRPRRSWSCLAHHPSA